MSDLTLIYGIKDVDVETFDEMFVTKCRCDAEDKIYPEDLIAYFGTDKNLRDKSYEQLLFSKQYQNIDKYVVQDFIPKKPEQSDGRYYYEVDLINLPPGVTTLAVAVDLFEDQYVSLPVNLKKLNTSQKSQVKRQYEELQQGLCYYCHYPLDGKPSPDSLKEYLNEDAISEIYKKSATNIFYNEYNEQTKISVCVVHNRCNFLMRKHSVQRPLTKAQKFSPRPRRGKDT